jgi:3-hydroxy-3-methylglutaryl CoA synthase
MAGIIGYGASIPQYRLKLEEIWDIWPDMLNTPIVIKKKRNLTEKVVARWDEDALSMGIQASKAAVEIAGISGKKVDAIYFGSCTNPCTTRPSSTGIAEALRTGTQIMTADCQFASKSGTAAMQICAAMVDAGMSKYALAVGSDALSRHIPPNDPLEYSASTGAGAVVIGKEKVIASIDGMFTYNTLTPEFFRLDGERYIKHGSFEEDEYTAGYIEHTKMAVEGYFKKSKAKPADFQYVATSQPDGKMPVDLMKELGFSEGQINPGMMAAEAGDFGSASAMLSLEAILDQSKANERILMVSYGSGAGCDVFDIKTTSLLAEARQKRKDYKSVRDLVNTKEYIGYSLYLRQERKLVQEFV